MPGNRFSRSKKRNSKPLVFALSITLIGSLCVGGVIFFENEKPTIAFENPVNIIGQESSIDIIVSDQKSGIQSIRVLMKQDNLEKEYFTVSNTRRGYGFNAGPSLEKENISLNIKDAGFKEGNAQLIVEAADFSLAGFFKGNTTRFVSEVAIDITPPKISILHSAQYISPGGSGLVAYQVSDDAIEHGIQLNDVFYRGYPVQNGSENMYNAFIALSYDTENIETAVVMATDEAGNITRNNFVPILKNRKIQQDRINVGDTFLKKKLPEIELRYPDLKGDPLEKYLYVNETIRRQNNAIIRQYSSTSLEEKLWKGRFLRMPGSLRAGFADHRTYYFQNTAIDKQVHLGVDIASIKKAEIRAANRGEVVFAEYLGIYGNLVLLDHGQGVFSLYSHLTQIDVEVGERVDKDKRLGLSGTTGMSGGDHLHFSMLVNGVFVTPVEWWDSRWLQVTFEQPLSNFKIKS